MLCLTGLPLIFYHEIEHALGNAVEPPELPGVTTQVSVDSIIQSAQAKRPQDVVQYLFRDPDEPEAWHVTMAEAIDAPEGSAFYMYDVRTGELLHEYPVRQGIMYFLFRLHLDMFAGLSGMLFLGAMGLLLAASLVSGVVVYGPFMSKLKFGTVRANKSSRVKWLDLHNLLGIVTLTWVLVVGLTGTINTLSLLVFNHWQSTELAALAQSAKAAQPLSEVANPASFQQALNAVSDEVPQGEVSFVAFPKNPFSTPDHFTFFMMGNTPLTSKLLTPVLVDAGTGTVSAVGQMPWYVTTLLLSQPLHFGDYAGMPLKILWAILDVLAIIVLLSGVYLWWKKRKVSIVDRLKLNDSESDAGSSVAGTVVASGAARVANP